MIPITSQQYAEIGRVAVQSGVLEREVEEYLIRLGTSFKVATLGPKLEALKTGLPSHIHDQSALSEFLKALQKTRVLVERRNAVMHGTWSRVGTTAISPVIAAGRKTSVSAREVAALANDIRNARMYLLRLCNEHHPVMDGGNKCPHTLETLRDRLSSVPIS